MTSQPFRPFDVSLVIPVRDEAATVRDLLASIRAQTRRPAEVVIVDGGSSDGTAVLLRQLADEDASLTVHVIEAGLATPGRGRNVGTAAARFEWIAYTDAGIRLDAAWLEELVAAAHRDTSASVVYGTYEPIVETFFDRCALLAYVPPATSRGDGFARGPFIASSLVRREAWKQAGGFPDLRAAEDLIFMENLERDGFRATWAPRALVWWRMQPSLAKTLRRFALFSKHNVLAGRQRYWHYGVARQYAAAAVFVVLAVLISRWWLLALAAAFVVRIGRGIWRRRGEHGWLWCMNPLQFLVVAAITIAIDAATFVGWAQALTTTASPSSAMHRDSLT